MSNRRRTFDSLSENFQEKIYNLLVEKYTLKGESNPSRKAWAKIKEKPLQTYRSWQRMNFFSMQAIDKSLKEKGLPPKHFQDVQKSI